MKKTELEDKISDATLNLIDMATDICWNKISRNCEYIMSEINNSTEQNYFLSTNIRKKVNDKKSPKSLNRIVSQLTVIYENIYDINLFIYKSLSTKTIIEIRCFMKTSFSAEFYPTIINNEPMLHCKVTHPSYIKELPNSTKLEKKFDVNWELGGIRHEWKSFLFRIKFCVWIFKYNLKQKIE